jgi:hypothetical protein
LQQQRKADGRYHDDEHAANGGYAQKQRARAPQSAAYRLPNAKHRFTSPFAWLHVASYMCIVPYPAQKSHRLLPPQGLKALAKAIVPPQKSGKKRAG